MGKRNTGKLRSFFRKYISPVYILLLLLSMLMWYFTKLSYNYTAEVPIPVRIEGKVYKVRCLAYGSGHQIFSYRYFRKSPLDIPIRDVHITPSVINSRHYIIEPYSLQDAISRRTSELQIKAVDDIPEITLTD